MGLDRTLLFRLATSERLERVATAFAPGEDVAWRLASRYVAGRTLDEALQSAAVLTSQGHAVSVDLFGELVRDPAIAARVLEQYRVLAAALPPSPVDAWLSLDLTHLALDADPAGARDRLASLASVLPAGRRLQIGAEDAGRTDAVLGCVLDVAARGLADQLGATVQANLVRSPTDVDSLTAAGLHVRLVKGAYVEKSGAHSYGEATDIAFLRLGARLAAAGTPWSIATHDGRLREALLMSFGPVPVEQLLGVRPAVLAELRERDVPTRVYVPYGPDWFRYWMRRVAESRGA